MAFPTTNFQTGTVITSDWLNAVNEKCTETVSVKDFGAVGDGVTDDTAAIQAAINTGKRVQINAGTYLVTDSLTLSNAGQTIEGDGRGVSIIVVKSGFNLSAAAIFNITSTEPGPEFKNFWIQYEQPTTSSRASLINYPTAILTKSTGTARVIIDSVRISNAMTAIDLRGNSGGSSIRNCELSAYNYHIKIDGSLDVINISDTRCWPFGINTTNQQIYYDAQTFGVYAGRVDGLYINNSMFICGTQVKLFSSVNGSSFGGISNCEFDNNAGIDMEAGVFSISNCFFSNNTTNRDSIKQIGGFLNIDNCNFLIGATSGITFINVSTTSSTRLYTTISNCTFNSDQYDIYNIYANTASGLISLNISNCLFKAVQNISYTKAKIYSGQNVQASIIGNQIIDKGTGTGDFVYVYDTECKTLRDNSFNGYTLTAPTNIDSTSIQDNVLIGDNSGGDYYNNVIVGSDTTKVYTGTLDGSGNAVFAHGLSGGNLRITNVFAVYQAVDNSSKPLSLNYIDGTNISISGSVASRKYKVYVSFVKSTLSW